MMSSTWSVLQGRQAPDLQSQPFEHLVNDAALPDAAYAELDQTFPAPSRFRAPDVEIKPNQAVRIPARLVLNDPTFSEAWRAFFAHHTSQAFWDEIVSVNGDAIRARHPQLEARAGRPLEQWRAKMRGTDGDADVSLDALFVINTPASVQASVRPAHVDYEQKIFAGLFYMQSASDDAKGGDLAFYRFKNRPAFGGHYARLEDLSEEKRIAYAPNRFVSFINSPASIHGVTPRAPSPHVRRYINFIAETPYAAFEIPRLSTLPRFTFWLQRRKTKNKGLTLKSVSSELS